MSGEDTIKYIDNEAVKDRDGHYVSVDVDVPCVLKSWQTSLFSFEWLLPDGRIKTLEELPEGEQDKRVAVESKLEKGEPIEKPVLGIGLMDNIEIGSGRAEFLTLAARGVTKIPVHIPKSNESDFKDFLAGVDSSA